MKSLLSKLVHNPFLQLLAGLMGLHVIEDTALVTVARYAPVPWYVLYPAVVVSSILMAQYAQWLSKRKDTPQ